jgi:hypothetical protein
VAKKDLLGQTFNYLTVIGYVKEEYKWLCRCVCGSNVVQNSTLLTKGLVKSCGCKSSELKKQFYESKFWELNENIIGSIFGFYTVESVFIDENDESKTRYCICKCICGTTSNVKKYDLVNGNAKSCGCKAGELIAKKVSFPTNEAQISNLYSTYKYGAKRRKLEFLISLDKVKSLIFENCFYCGSEPNSFRKSQRILKTNQPPPLVYNGIDRINNDIGYTETNVVPCCIICNRAKREMSYENFLLWLDRVVAFRGAKNAA